MNYSLVVRRVRVFAGPSLPGRVHEFACLGVLKTKFTPIINYHIETFDSFLENSILFFCWYDLLHIHCTLEVLLKAHKLLFVNIWISCSNFCVPTSLHKLDHLLLFLSLYSSCKIILYKGIFVIHWPSKSKPKLRFSPSDKIQDAKHKNPI